MSAAELPTILTNKPKTQESQVNSERMLSFYVYETIPFCRMVTVTFLFPVVEIPIIYISSPKILGEERTQKSVDLFCFSILMFTPVQSLIMMF